MTKQFKIISLAMLMLVFATGQGDATWCGCDLQGIVADIFDGTGCVGGCVSDCGGDCGGCGDCMSCMDCSDCSDCGGCDGCSMTKIPGTYRGPASNDVVQVRLTSHAIGYLESMLLREKLGETLSPFPLFDKEEVFEVQGATLRICRGAAANNNIRCDISFKITHLDVEPLVRGGAQADQLRLALNVEAWTTHIDEGGTSKAGWPMTLIRDFDVIDCGCSGWRCSCDVAVLQPGDCTLEFDTRKGGQKHIGINLTFSLGTSGVNPRGDINIIDIEPLTNSGLSGINPSQDISQSGDCAWTVNQIDSDLGTALTNAVVNELRLRLPRLVKGFLCEDRNDLLPAPGAGNCPTPSIDQTFEPGIPAFMNEIEGCGNPGGSDDLRTSNCLPRLLGLEGRIDLSSLMSALVPGFNVVIDFIMAAAGEATSPNNGLSIWLKGGLHAVADASQCVPELPAEEVPPIPNVPKTQVFQGNSHPGGRATDVMVGVAEAFVNRAAYDLWNTGALCLQISSATLPMLDPALVGILFASDLKNLVFPASDSDSPLGVGLRPQKPPTIRFDNAEGGGVKVGVAMPELQLDFYAWSLDRYVRFVTFQLDIDIAVAVKANAGKIQLDLLGVDITNTRALNDSLISNGGSAANLITGVVGSLLPAFLGDSGPLFELDIAGILPETLELAGMEIPMPLSIELRDDALAAVYTNASGATIPARDENGHAFLGVFVDFAGGTGGGGSPLTAAVDTQVDITSVYIPEDKSAFAAETFGQGELPRVEFVMSASAPAGVPVEYRYRLALGGWSEWQDSPYGVIEDPLLLLQQEHTIFARARVKGEPRTEDRSSAKARFSTDVTPPMVDITAEAKGIRIQAVDFHTRASELEYRFREPEGEFSEWAKLGPEATALIDASRDVEVEVRDAAGNVASNVAELRGLPPSSAAAGGCSCSAAGPVSGSSNSLLGFLAMVAMVGGMMYRLRRREEKV